MLTCGTNSEPNCNCWVTAMLVCKTKGATCYNLLFIVYVLRSTVIKAKMSLTLIPRRRNRCTYKRH